MGSSEFIATPRHIFVSMLFALAIGRLAQEGYAILVSESGWQSQMQAGLQWILGLAFIITSWVDWSASFEVAGPYSGKVWSKETAFLILDVLILFGYFSLIASIAIEDPLAVSSIRPEIYSSLFIFVLYLVWDKLFYVDSGKLDLMQGLLPSFVSILLCLILLLLNFLFRDTEFQASTATVLAVSLFLVLYIFRRLHTMRQGRLPE